MSLELTKVHEIQTRKGGQSFLARTNPYIRLRQGDEPPIFIQSGVFYYEGGATVEELPPWAKDELAKVSPKALEEVGIGAVKQPVKK